MATRFTLDFDQRVFAIALTDSPMEHYLKHTDGKVLRVLKKVRISCSSEHSDRSLLVENNQLGREWGAGEYRYTRALCLWSIAIGRFVRQMRDLGRSHVCDCLGHRQHEWTSHAAFQAIFEYFSVERQRIQS